jgi:hypothetical protein
MMDKSKPGPRKICFYTVLHLLKSDRVKENEAAAT